jgi:putative ABC transport system permease protein
MGRAELGHVRERWALFVGPGCTVCLGVALVQSSLLTLISVAVLRAPRLSAAARAQFTEGATTAWSR